MSALPYDARVPRRQAERSDTTRKAIIDAATALFAEHGYERSGIEQIAERAGVSKGALYHHYRDKAEVLAAVYEQLEHELVERLLTAAPPGSDAIEALKAGSRAFLDACVDPAYRQIALVDAPAGLGWERWRQIDADAGGFGLLRVGLQVAADSGELPAEHLDERAHLLLALLMEAALLVGRADDPQAMRAVMGSLVDEQLDHMRNATR